MHIGVGSVAVRASIDVHQDTAITCCVDEQTREMEVSLGSEGDAVLFLTEGGARKLAEVLAGARRDRPTAV
jgi:hypothetical protein